MKWVVYYAVTLGLNVACMIAFHENLHLEFHSVIPIFLIGLSIFLSVYYRTNPSRKDFSTNNHTDLTEEEWGVMAAYSGASGVIVVPLLLPFVCFFSTWAKLLSILVFFGGFVGGAVFYRLRHRKEYEARFAKEANELEEQKKREELGKWK
ncbi:MAG: hypothetical protein IJX28_06080 [Clostridia bacterium]|nr:hypothetical protein [Clostridia bacterium]